MPLTFTDSMRGEDRVNLEALLIAKDQMNWRPKWTIHRFARDPHGELTRLSRAGVDTPLLVRKFSAEYLGCDVYEGNLLLNTGINSTLWPLIIGSGGTALSNANSYLGTGTSSASGSDPTQTGLLANPVFVAVDATYPQGPTAQVVSWRSTFGSGVANQAWNEICVANANTNASGTVVNRLVQTMGTKASPAVWLPILQITLS
jgi:hypothetical protein